MSTTSASYGSIVFPSTSLRMTCGRDSANSKPSRRMFSARIDRCSSPRPLTSKRSGRSVSRTRSATSLRSSRSSRSLMLRDVTYLPSVPANGESLTIQNIETVGSSMAIGSRRSGASAAVNVSPISTSAKPAMATISPAAASFDFLALQTFEHRQLRYAALLCACRREESGSRPRP